MTLEHPLGWEPLDAAWWPSIAASLTKPWPDDAIRFDLRWWAARERMKDGTRPGRPALVERWGCADWKARTLMRDETSWGDSLQPPSSRTPAVLQKSSSGSPAEQRSKRNHGAESSSDSPADLQLFSSPPPEVLPTRVGSQITDTDTDTDKTDAPVPAAHPPTASHDEEPTLPLPEAHRGATTTDSDTGHTPPTVSAPPHSPPPFSPGAAPASPSGAGGPPPDVSPSGGGALGKGARLAADIERVTAQIERLDSKVAARMRRGTNAGAVDAATKAVRKHGVERVVARLAYVASRPRDGLAAWWWGLSNRTIGMLLRDGTPLVLGLDEEASAAADTDSAPSLAPVSAPDGSPVPEHVKTPGERAWASVCALEGWQLYAPMRPSPNQPDRWRKGPGFDFADDPQEHALRYRCYIEAGGYADWMECRTPERKAAYGARFAAAYDARVASNGEAA